MNNDRPAGESDYHRPVLTESVLQYLLTTPDGLYIDATLGGGGHAQNILDHLSSNGRLVGIDTDIDAINYAARRLAPYGTRIRMVHHNFRNMKSALVNLGLSEPQGILFDLGVSSHQFDEPQRGFSFQADTRLDMRMNVTQPFDAEALVNEYDERQLADLFWRYGEERKARHIARAIVRQRTTKTIHTTGELADIVGGMVGGRYHVKALARIFQAIRIEVNDEMETLKAALQDAINLVVRGGRIVVLSYHSLEDRIVKEMFKAAAATMIPSGHKLEADRTVVPQVVLLTKKAVKPTEEECRENPRARSAKLRAVEKLRDTQER